MILGDSKKATQSRRTETGVLAWPDPPAAPAVFSWNQGMHQVLASRLRGKRAS